MFGLSLIMVLVFSPVAAISSYLITYAEYKKHFPDDLRRARKLSLQYALATFIFFAILIFLAVTVLNKFITK